MLTWSQGLGDVDGETTFVCFRGTLCHPHCLKVDVQAVQVEGRRYRISAVEIISGKGRFVAPGATG